MRNVRLLNPIEHIIVLFVDTVSLKWIITVVSLIDDMTIITKIQYRQMIKYCSTNFSMGKQLCMLRQLQILHFISGICFPVLVSSSLIGSRLFYCVSKAAQINLTNLHLVCNLIFYFLYSLVVFSISFRYFIQFWKGDLSGPMDGKFHVLFVFFVAAMFAVITELLY